MTIFNWIYLEINFYILALYHTYQLLYCKGSIQIKSSHSTINMEKLVNKDAMNTLRNYTRLYHTHLLLFCKRHIQMVSNHSTINVETKRPQRTNYKIILNKIN